METKNLSTIAQWYIENGKYQILWDHVKLKHPLITENIIVNLLVYGYHDYDKSEPNRFISKGKIKDKKYQVIYEYDLIENEDILIIITAFEKIR